MILALLALALVLQVPDSVRVRGVARDTTLAVIATPSGGALRADVVLPLIGGSVSPASAGALDHHGPRRAVHARRRCSVRDDRRTARFLWRQRRFLRNGALLLPLQILADIVPRIGNRVIWDADSRELRVFRNLAKRTSVAPVRAAVQPPARAAAASAAASAPPPARRRLIVVDAGPRRTGRRNARTDRPPHDAVREGHHARASRRSSRASSRRAAWASS